MCTLIVLNRMHPEYPLIVAANRDEFRDRDSLPPQVVHAGASGRVKAIAGRDLLAGGTWLGVNEFGVVAGVTNRRAEAVRNSSMKSRGSLVLESLAAGSLEGVGEVLSSYNWEEFNPFNFFYGDTSGAVLCTNHGGERSIELPPGPYVLTNQDLEDQGCPEARRIVSRVGVLPREGEGLVKFLIELLKSHEGADVDSLSATCVHLDFYGTLSSTIILMAEDKACSRYLHCEGAPCGGRFVDRSAELTALLAGDGAE